MYSKNQRIAALIGIILLVGLYLATLICAIFNFDGTGRLFQACLFATIGVPLLIWIYIGLYGMLTKKHTMASLLDEKDYELLQKIKNDTSPDDVSETETLQKKFPKRKK